MGTLSRDAEECELKSQKSLQSRSSDYSVLSVRVQVMETLISNLFGTVSALKTAYMELQAAHSPYDPRKLQIADRAVIDELRRFSELKHSYLERHAALVGGQVHDFPGQLEIQNKEAVMDFEGIIGDFQSEIHKKNAEVETLRDMLAQMTLKKEKLERRVKRLDQRVVRDSPVDVSNELSPTPYVFQSTVREASEAAGTFAKLLISMMKTSQWDLDAASNSIEAGVSYTRRSHRKYAFQSYVCHRMLTGFENENFYMDGSLSFVLDPEMHRRDCFNQFLDMSNTDPMEMVSANPDCMFGRFCKKKFLDLVHPKMEDSFFGTLEHRTQLTNGTHPCTQFYQSFLRLAMAMWLVHRLAFSFDPTASIFQVRKDTEFSPIYMESIVPGLEKGNSSPAVVPKVGITVMPGFRVEKTIIKCQVYVMPVKVDE
eukprot:c27372_g1_i1 orf=815-2095(-)